MEVAVLDSVKLDGEGLVAAEFAPIKMDEDTKTNSSAALNGNHHEDDENNAEELTPPPDSPMEDSVGDVVDDGQVDDVIEEPVHDPVDDTVDEPMDDRAEDTMSHTSSVPANTLEDEIVVGHKAGHKANSNAANNGDATNKSSPAPIISSPDDVEMEESIVEEQQPVTTSYPKRKRTSLYPDLNEDNTTRSATPAREDAEVRQKAARPAKTHGIGGVKGVTLGYWRDSQPPNPIDKHSVIGFIDVRDRLRTRIQPTTRDGRNIAQEYPLPPGPGGSWVTFEKVAFDTPLVNLDHYQVKEYVKIRAETVRKDETPEEKAKLDDAAIKEAIHRVQTNPPPETAVPPAIAYGPQIPEHAQLSNRPDTKKRRLAGSYGSASSTPAVNPHPIDNIPGTRPTRILLGYWKQSSEEDPFDKHAVYGILGANDMFRVKLMRETRSGRPIQGNFPVGAGGLWIHWDEVEFEPHLKHLSRPEIKEYCRVRQRQQDEGESSADYVGNIQRAVVEAQQRVAHSLAGTNGGTPAARKEEPPRASVPPPIAMKGSSFTNDSNGGGGYDESSFDGQQGSSMSAQAAAAAAAGPKRELMPHELRHPRRHENGINPRGRHSLPDVELRAANRPQSADVLERTNTIARREIARVEQAQIRAEQRAATRESAGVAAAAAAAAGASGDAVSGEQQPAAPSNKSMFQDNVSRLNKVWAAQEANRIKAGAEDAKMYMGIKYERKQNGPFQGKLVSQGTIISIDGEDYVEYRVLTKPTFF
ncbi:hypothetical protein B0T17DRAFT_586385 [Bombardia bombarda]|uniref:Uncharacterized protein n=1 Tax=Bombardia bombarda TaxID=252184 RepID=A0AA39XIH5_9PEZI|nr:hypothetical protein B0T17DRAFT_586385 [Bombardia bombarda]